MTTLYIIVTIATISYCVSRGIFRAIFEECKSDPYLLNERSLFIELCELWSLVSAVVGFWAALYLIISDLPRQ